MADGEATRRSAGGANRSLEDHREKDSGHSELRESVRGADETFRAGRVRCSASVSSCLLEGFGADTRIRIAELPMTKRSVPRGHHGRSSGTLHLPCE